MTYTPVPGGVCAPLGFTAAGMHCGVRKNRSKKDIALIYSAVPCTAAAVYTQNKVYGAPITVTRENLSDGIARAVICNSGNANTANADGVEKARAMCVLTGEALRIDPRDVIVASTGVIGQSLNLEPIANGIRTLPSLLSENGSEDAAWAIMTTDTRLKEISFETQIGGKSVRFGAITKGSGMIHPNMATMLSFITTDVCASAEMLSKALRAMVEETYNMVSVDGDTSTNDMVSVMASGLAGNEKITGEGEDYDALLWALRQVGLYMAPKIAADGEGATKLLTCTVTGAPAYATARTLAKSVIGSSLVKSMFFGADANWGRLLCAMGYSGAQYDAAKVEISLSSQAGSLCGVRDGFCLPFDEDEAKKILSKDSIQIDIDLHQGTAQATAWGCDLTYEYVKINGDYRT